MKGKMTAIFRRDRRQSVAADILSEAGFFCVLFGGAREEGDTKTACLSYRASLLAQASAVILPIPSVTGNGEIPTEEGKKPVLFSEAVSALPRGAFLFGAMLGEEEKNLCAKRGIRYTDLLEEEETARENGIATAEGALALLTENIPRTFTGLPIAVTGFGRIAAALAKRLLSLGADVTVFARRKEARDKAAAAGCRAEPTEELSALLPRFAAWVNTVPFPLIGKETLSALPKKLFLLELASAPGGFDFDFAKEAGLSALRAPGLPGKLAAVTIGEKTAETVLRVLGKEKNGP